MNHRQVDREMKHAQAAQHCLKQHCENRQRCQFPDARVFLPSTDGQRHEHGEQSDTARDHAVAVLGPDVLDRVPLRRIDGPERKRPVGDRKPCVTARDQGSGKNQKERACDRRNGPAVHDAAVNRIGAAASRPRTERRFRLCHVVAGRAFHSALM